ncbi:hypothetical protein LR48_Vigan07g197800 [Vigna angularis]|uniref:Uncharacterized protein n=1 Tax=Phaseolus angularis TaxID=3914 RepID=A0A0L9V0I8_PHAAN|nr:hypothetical protein LR48_Vigan07g197800 [Vigna angularis]
MYSRSFVLVIAMITLWVGVEGEELLEEALEETDVKEVFGKVGDKRLVRAIDMVAFELDLLEEYDSRFKKLSLGDKLPIKFSK